VLSRATSVCAVLFVLGAIVLEFSVSERRRRQWLAPHAIRGTGSSSACGAGDSSTDTGEVTSHS
jgi:hypothetical protein